MKARVFKASYVTFSRIPKLRAMIRECPNEEYRSEGLAALRGRTKGEYLINLIPQDHPDRIGIVDWLTSGKHYWN